MGTLAQYPRCPRCNERLHVYEVPTGFACCCFGSKKDCCKDDVGMGTTPEDAIDAYQELFKKPKNQD